MRVIKVKVKPNARASVLKEGDDGVWQAQLRQAAVASRLATVLVDEALRRGAPTDDLLAVVVRAR